jgi:hypothetical protein
MSAYWWESPTNLRKTIREQHSRSVGRSFVVASWRNRHSHPAMAAVPSLSRATAASGFAPPQPSRSGWDG